MSVLESPVLAESKAEGNGEPNISAEELARIAGTEEHDADDLEIGEIFELLKNERRRRVIGFLKEQDDYATTLGVVAEYIAALENDVEVAQLSSSQRKRVYIALYQCHLPKMDHFGVVDFDKNRGTIELRNTRVLDRYLDGQQPRDAGDEVDRTDLAVACLVALSAAIGVSGVGPLSLVPGVYWTVLSVVALLWVAT